MTANPPLPSYAQLPVRDDAPAGSSWGVWDDQRLGTLNLLDRAAALRGRDAVRRGVAFALDLGLREIDPPLFGRSRAEHEIHEYPSGAQDDIIHGWNTQGSTQWDGFRHARHPEHGHYGGLPNERHGTDAWAARGIVTRGVVVDVAGWRAEQGRALEHASRDRIEAGELRACLAAQDLEIEPGDVLLLHTGWLSWYRDLPEQVRAALSAHTAATMPAPGLAATTEMTQLLWDLHVAAIAADNPTLEAWPRSETERYLHFDLLTLLGVPIGELWDLGPLAADCRAEGTWTCLLTSAPLNVPGGVGTPANAIAVR
jgi:kynurenine formamidase